MSSKRPPSGRIISSLPEDGEKKRGEAVVRPDFIDGSGAGSGSGSPPMPMLSSSHPPLDVDSNNTNANQNTRRGNNSSPPLSALRLNYRGESVGKNNSVSFIGEINNSMNIQMDYTNSPSPASNNATSISAASSSAAAAAAASQQQHRRFPVSSLTSNSSMSSSSRQRITLERVVSSQFENEAETHILAALEMDNNHHNHHHHQYNPSSQLLLGEGIERGMEDYSDDEEDPSNAQQLQLQQQARSRTWSNDSFLRNVTKQNDLPQYQIRFPGPDVDSEHHEHQQPPPPPQQQLQQSQQLSQSQQPPPPPPTPQQQQQQQPPPPQLRRYISENLPPIDENRLAMHILRENYEDHGGGGGGGEASLFVEAAKRVNPSSDGTTTVAAATTTTATHHVVWDGNIIGGVANGKNAATNGTQQSNSDSKNLQGDDIDGSSGDANENGDGGGTSKERGTAPTTTTTTTTNAPVNIVDGVNTMTDVTETTDNMNFMANRLRSLQERRGSLQRSRGSLNFNHMGFSSRSTASSTTTGSDDSFMGHETSGDKLIDALNSVDSSKNKSFLSKIRSEYTELIVPKLPQFRQNIAHILLYMVIPCLTVAAVLYYMCDNPMAGKTGTSISWWIIFLGVRQPIIFELTLVGEVFWVEIFALRSKLFNRAVGPYISLAFIQSRGWPYIICFWAVLDFVFLYGDYPFPKHWLFWQSKLDMFNSSNPVVGVLNSELYLRILLSCIFFGVAASLKRLFLAIFLGRRAVTHFGPELETLMAKMIIIGEVANLSKDIERRQALFADQAAQMYDPVGESERLVRFQDFMTDENSSIETNPSPKISQRKSSEVPSVTNSPPRPEPGQSPTRIPAPSSPSKSSVTNGRPQLESSSSANLKLMNLLSEWEEPELITRTKHRATVRDLVQFKKAVTCMNDKYPFSHAFGHAQTREMCVQSSQEVYDRLMLSVSGFTELPFSILSVLAINSKGDFEDAKIKSLIRLFRPDRQGNLGRLDFVKSIDTVYKQLRLLRASIANSAQIDYAFERIVNCFFYFFLVIVAVAILGIDIWTVFLSFNTFFLGFSFLFGAAASNYFEGLLLIFVRRPYDIGDRIATSNPKNDTNPMGSSTWYVERVTLFTTTVRFATTNEVATYSNGSLAILRIINANRSPKAFISISIKFGLETPFHKINVFREAVEKFIKARPREWIAMNAFRAARLEADLGYVEYKLLAQHRESWQNIGPICQSKADLSSFCLEATKKLDIKYESPPMPVNLSASGGNLALGRIFDDDDDAGGGGGGDANNPKGGGDVDANKEARKKKMTAGDLQDVADWFPQRTKKKN